MAFATDKPRRRVMMLANIQADTREDLAAHLRNLSMQMERGELNGPTSISGSPSVGHIIEITEDPAITHDSYFQEIEAYLAKLEGKGGAR